jgi:phosphate transport system protein
MISDTRESFDRKIQEHLESIIILGSMVEQSLLDAVEALKERDLDRAREVYEHDQVINEKRYEIERKALITVATQQPLATDLRRLASIIDLAGELERIGDYAKGIARIAIRLGDQPPLKELVHIPKMAELTADMLHRAIGAFVELDEATALSIPEEDDQVDDLYNRLYKELLEIMIGDRNTIDRATFHLWVSHNLERAADRVTNICERTVFTTSAELVEFDRTDDEDKAF